jgi:hypothetical protein
MGISSRRFGAPRSARIMSDPNAPTSWAKRALRCAVAAAAST